MVYSATSIIVRTMHPNQKAAIGRFATSLSPASLSAETTSESTTSFSLSDVEAFIAANKWTFAKTMPQMPHWYVVRERATSDAAFSAVVGFIRAHGEPRAFGRRKFVYLDVGDYTYWTMGSAIAETTILNRANR